MCTYEDLVDGNSPLKSAAELTAKLKAELGQGTATPEQLSAGEPAVEPGADVGEAVILDQLARFVDALREEFHLLVAPDLPERLHREALSVRAGLRVDGEALHLAGVLVEWDAIELDTRGRATKDVLAALHADAKAMAERQRDVAAVIVCPSNPYLSIDPILAMPGVRKTLANLAAPIVAVSPIIGGAPVRAI